MPLIRAKTRKAIVGEIRESLWERGLHLDDSQLWYGTENTIESGKCLHVQAYSRVGPIDDAFERKLLLLQSNFETDPKESHPMVYLSHLA